MGKRLAWGGFIGGLTTAALMGFAYFFNQWLKAPFLPFDFFNWFTRELPGGLITFGIDLMIDTMRALNLSVVDLAKTAERISAVMQFLAIGVVVGALVFALAGRVKLRGRWLGLGVGVLLSGIFTAIVLAINTSSPTLLVLIWVPALLLAWGWIVGIGAEKVLGTAAQEIVETTDPHVARLDRRRFLLQLGASTATITVLGAGIGAVLNRREQAALIAAQESIAVEPGAEPVAQLPNADNPVQPAPGTRPEYTPIADHYQVFLQTEPTLIEEEDWVLPITGMVDNPLMLTLDDFRNNFTPAEQYVTLSCISGRIGTSLISTTKWTGVSAQEVLAAAGVQDEAQYLFISSGDGFYETVEIELIRNDPRIMFCYAWDDQLLPKDHGFPLRIWIPDRYGMKQPKWITGIEVTDEYTDGYWVERNWDKIARVRTTSVIDTAAVDELLEENGQTYIPVGGIAFSGDRQISKVEVRLDEGEWQSAMLRAPLSETTWVIWRYNLPFAAGDHTLQVRCTEGNGTPQIEEQNGNRPSGATGLHEYEFEAEL